VIFAVSAHQGLTTLSGTLLRLPPPSVPLRHENTVLVQRVYVIQLGGMQRRRFHPVRLQGVAGPLLSTGNGRRSPTSFQGSDTRLGEPLHLLIEHAAMGLQIQ
jgi:hypothetical protein